MELQRRRPGTRYGAAFCLAVLIPGCSSSVEPPESNARPQSPLRESLPAETGSVPTLETIVSELTVSDSESTLLDAGNGDGIPESDNVVANMREANVADGSDEPVTLMPKPGALMPKPGGTVYRALLPTSQGPLVVDIEITLDQQPLDSVFVKRIERVITTARGDADKLTWAALFDHIGSDPTQYGGIPNVMPQNRKEMIDRYDRDRDGDPDPNEVARYLFQQSQTSLPFRLFGTDHYRGVNRSRSSLIVALDQDENRVLDHDEIGRAGAAIERLDQNGDQRIDQSETILATSDPANMPWNRRRSTRWGEVAMDLSGQVDWSMLSYSLDAMTAAGPFGSETNRIGELDQDADGSIDADEARKLPTVDPDLRLRVDFSSDLRLPSTIGLMSVAAEIEPLVEIDSTAQQVSVVGRPLRLTARVVPSVGAVNQFPFQAFVMFDVNNDGGLDESEIPEPARAEYSLEDLDEDHDRKLSYTEIVKGMQPKTSLWSIQVRARAAEVPDAVFAWLDSNQDHRLSTREVKSAGDRLRMLASDGGTLTPNDFPDSYLIQFGRGMPSEDEQVFSQVGSEQALVDARPRWAQAQDVNRDGDISRAEFTGTTRQFAAFDTNGDQFIDASELR